MIYCSSFLHMIFVRVQSSRTNISWASLVVSYISCLAFIGMFEDIVLQSNINSISHISYLATFLDYVQLVVVKLWIRNSFLGMVKFNWMIWLYWLDNIDLWGMWFVITYNWMCSLYNLNVFVLFHSLLVLLTVAEPRFGCVVNWLHSILRKASYLG